MLLSAASAFLTIASAGGASQVLSAEEQKAWAKVRPSIVKTMSGATEAGIGVCVDKRGYFLAHRSAVPFPTLFAKLSSGPQIELRRVAMDDTTQLVLLHAPRLPAGMVNPVALGSEPEKAGGSLLAVLASGPLRAEFVSGEKVGVVNPSRRLMPLNELRFETHSSQIGGGLVFTLDGTLLGVLGATLGTGEQARSANAKFQDTATLPQTFRGGGGLGGPGGAAPPTTLSVPRSQFGPGVLTVAYSVSSSVLHRVVGGLMSPDRKVQHPAIGVLCKDAGSGGAEVTSIVPGSPAETAGLRVGDVIVAIGEAAVRNQFDVGRITMRLRIGATVDVKLLRNGQEMTLQVGVGAS